MRILIIDDNPYDAELSQRSLKTIAGIRFDYVENFTNFKELFSPGKYEAVISDYALSDCFGTDVLKYVKELEPDIPFIIVSGTLGEEAAVEILRLGATDYVLKDSIDKLSLALSRALKEAEEKKAAKSTRQKLEQSEKRFRALIEKSSDVKIMTTIDGKIWYGSPSFTFVLGYSHEEYINKSLVDFIHSDDIQRLKEKRIEILETPGNSYYSQLRLRHKNGTWIWAEGSATNLLHESGVNAIVSNFRDITERKFAEEEILKKNDQLRELTTHLQNIREEERTHIAREIHDELGQQITALKMDIDWVAHKQNNQETIVVSKLKTMLGLCDGIIGTVRKISSDLRPSIIDDLGLIAALEWKCNDFEEKMGISCQFNSSVKERKFENHFSINAYRILQETLTNVAKHAAANSVTVSVSENETELLMEINDDGKGFSNENVSNKKTLGILGMKERAVLLGGELTITGTQDKGTHINLILPFKNEDTDS